MTYTYLSKKIAGTVFHKLQRADSPRTGIFEVGVCQRGFNINSESAYIGRHPIQLIFGQTPEEMAAAFKTDRNARLSAGNSIAMSPWANRMIGPVVNHNGAQCVEVSFQGQSRFVPTNLGDYRLHGLIYASDYEGVRINELPSGGIALTGTAFVSGEQWFSDLLYTHTIALENVRGEDAMTRSVNVTNTGNAPAPVSVGEHPYFQIPGYQFRSQIVMRIPGTSTILLGEDANPDFSVNPVAPAEDSPLSDIFARGGKLGELHLNNSFLNLQPTTLESGIIRAGVVFGSGGYGIFVSTPQDNSVNVLHGFAPIGTDHPADGKAVAIEFQGNLLSPLDPRWEEFSPLKSIPGMHPSGMRILAPGDSMNWQVTHTVVELQ